MCLCSPSRKTDSSTPKGCGGNCGPHWKYWQPTAGFMTHVTCRLTAMNRDQLRNLTLGNRVWATFTFSRGGLWSGRWMWLNAPSKILSRIHIRQVIEAKSVGFNSVSGETVKTWLNICKYGGSVAEWLACWTQVLKYPGSNRCRDVVSTVLGKLFTPNVPLFTKQTNW